VALTGVVINDSVVLIDDYNRQRRQGGGSKAAEKDARDNTVEALEQAVRRRFRPILLTTMTTSLALLPMLLETSLQARFLIPMAISLAFGCCLPVCHAVFAACDDHDGRRCPAPHWRQLKPNCHMDLDT